jgi:hypothetical protein
VKALSTAALGLGILGLAACNQSAREQKADNIEVNAEAKADNLEQAAGNATNDVREDALQNQADKVRERGEEKADATRSSADLDGNSADDTTSGNSSKR